MDLIFEMLATTSVDEWIYLNVKMVLLFVWILALFFPLLTCFLDV